MKRLTLLVCTLLYTLTAISQSNLSNKGREFWVAWGHNSLNLSASFYIYITADQTSNVTISIPGSTYIPQTFTVAAGAVVVRQIPSQNAYQITTAGLVSNKTVHIESDEPVVAYAHSTGSTSSGATMLLPVETYGYKYSSLNPPQDYSASYSWFYVVASQNNTTIEFTPTIALQGGYAAGVTRTVTLSKGQVFNGMSVSTAADVSGTQIKSIANSSGDCYPIAVFSGSSRTMFCQSSASSNGGDYVIQQVFPASAWGTRYLTFPTALNGNPSNSNVNRYRISVRDPATVVRRNGTQLTAIINNSYYDVFSSSGEYFTADKPILVAQMMVSQDCNNQVGDPEMFYVSPVEQAIKSITFYNTSVQAIVNSYVNIIVPTSGLASLRIDGSAAFDRVAAHPQLAGYSCVVKNVANNIQHNATCDVAFNAITYGMGTHESYGYNAGTLVNNLNSVPTLNNANNTTSVQNTYTCRYTPVNFAIKSIYRPTQLVWRFSSIAGIVSPAADVTIANPVPNNTEVINGITYYTYNLPGNYEFNALGIHHIPVSITAADIDNCTNTEIIDYGVEVKAGITGTISTTYSGCVSDAASFSAINIPAGASVTQYMWSFPSPAATAITQTATHTFNTSGTHNVGLHLVTADGCVGDTVFTTVVTNPSPLATFGITPQSVCFNNAPFTVSFTDTSSFGATPIQNYYWDFGDPSSGAANTSTLQNPTHTYTAAGTYTIKHTAGVSTCNSAVKEKTFTLYDKPAVDISFPDVCLQDSTQQFTALATVNDGQTLSYAWNFGDPSSGAANTSTLQNPAHKYIAYGTYPVTLTVTTANGCATTFTKPYTVKGYTTTINYSIENEASLCAQNAVKLTNLMDVATFGINRIDIYWDFGNNATAFETFNNPATNQVFTHSYADFTSPASKAAVIKWVVYSTGPCESISEKTITLHATPDVVFGPVVPGFCINATTGTVASANVANALTGAGIYSGTGVDGAGNFNPALAGVGGPYNIKYVFTSSLGCKDSATATIKVFAKPAADFTIDRTTICAKDSVLLTATSTLTAGTIASHQWNFGDATNAVKPDATPFYHAYLNTGSPISITYKAISDSGCISDEVTKTVNVNALPVAGFTAGTQNCGSTSITYTPTSTSPGLVAWNWNLDEGQLFNNTAATPVTGAYATPGIKTVTHTVSAGPGCVSDPVTQSVTVFAGITALFNTNYVCLAADSLTTFNNQSSSPDGQTLTYLWNFDDPASGANNTSTAVNPTHKFTDYNLHNVTLTVTGATNCPITYTLPYRVRGFVPAISFTVANEANLCVQNAVSLTNNMNVTADSVYRIDMYWDFANDPSAFTQINNPVQGASYTNMYANFTSPATKTIAIKWIVYTKGQCPNEITKTITLNATPDINLPAIIPGVCINATGSIINAASVTNTIGTGVYSGTGVSANGAFDAAIAGVGTHTITYTFTSASGCTATKTAAITVFPQPVANFTVTSNICQGQDVLFTNSSTISSGNIQTYNWVYGDNGANTDTRSSGAPFNYTYNAYGNFSPQLIAVSDSGCTSAPFTQPVVIKANPVSAFTLPAAVCLPLAEANFTNQSNLPGGNAAAITYQWNFGEPASSTNTSTATSPTHYYSPTGTGPYTVRLVATAFGCSDTLDQVLSAIYQQPIAKFGKDAANGCSDKPITFSDSSLAPGSTVTAWAWTFTNNTTGNVTTATQQSPVRTLPSGNYTVSLIAQSAQGCFSPSADSTVVVYLQPVIDAGANILVDEFVNTQLNATTNSSTFTFTWSPSTYLSNVGTLNPTVIAPEFNQVYKLTAVGDGGCTASDTVKLTVLKTLNVPTAFSPNGDGINDTYTVPYLEDYPGATVEIFNRYGQSVWRDSGAKPWDGKLNGKVLPMGVYYYIIQPKNKGYGKLSGNITLLY